MSFVGWFEYERVQVGKFMWEERANHVSLIWATVRSLCTIYYDIFSQHHMIHENMNKSQFFMCHVLAFGVWKVWHPDLHVICVNVATEFFYRVSMGLCLRFQDKTDTKMMLSAIHARVTAASKYPW